MTIEDCEHGQHVAWTDDQERKLFSGIVDQPYSTTLTLASFEAPVVVLWTHTNGEAIEEPRFVVVDAPKLRKVVRSYDRNLERIV